MASYSGTHSANYLVSLPDPERTLRFVFIDVCAGCDDLFRGQHECSGCKRFAQEANSYNASNIALVNLTLYLRAGYYLAAGNTPGASRQCDDRSACTDQTIGRRYRSHITQMRRGVNG